MTLALAALVLASLNPTTTVVSTSLGQKIQIIKGGKKGGAKASELSPQVVQDNSAANAKAQELDRKSADLDARNKDLAQREQALDEKQQAATEQEKTKADKQKALQKKIEKIGEQNEAHFGTATDSLAGD